MFPHELEPEMRNSKKSKKKKKSKEDKAGTEEASPTRIPKPMGVEPVSDTVDRPEMKRDEGEEERGEKLAQPNDGERKRGWSILDEIEESDLPSGASTPASFRSVDISLDATLSSALEAQLREAHRRREEELSEELDWLYGELEGKKAQLEEAVAQIHIANEEHVRLMEKIGRMEKDSEGRKRKERELKLEVERLQAEWDLSRATQRKAEKMAKEAEKVKAKLENQLKDREGEVEEVKEKHQSALSTSKLRYDKIQIKPEP